jgi:hypothetical protein
MLFTGFQRDSHTNIHHCKQFFINYKFQVFISPIPAWHRLAGVLGISGRAEGMWPMESHTSPDFPHPGAESSLDNL